MSVQITVSTLEDLYTALGSAKGGEVIKLAPGDYGTLSLDMRTGIDLSFPSNVTITSQDPRDPAVFDGMALRDVSNLTFDGVVFDYTFEPGDQIFDRPFSVGSSENITIRNSVFDGDVAEGVSAVDDGFGFAIGFSARDSTGITFENNETYEFHRGAVFSDSTDLIVSGNEVHSIRMDGFNFAQVENVLVEDNMIHNFRGSPDSDDHSDMIQFWTAGTDAPSKNVIIRGNHLDIGDGSPTQSIFFRNEVVDRELAGTEMFYQDFLIAENVIINGHAHGITVGQTAGLTIMNNSVLHSDGGAADGLDPFVEIPRIYLSEASTDVVVSGNVSSDILGYAGQADWSLGGNVLVQDQDPAATNHYSDVFVTSSLDRVDGLHQIRAVEGGAVALAQAGAPATYGAGDTDGVQAAFHVTQSPDDASVRFFDATPSTFNGGALPAGATYQWAFADGGVATGAQASYQFTEGSSVDVKLIVTLPDGAQSVKGMVLDVDGAMLVSYDQADGVLAHNAGTETVVATPANMTADGIQLGGATSSLTIDREHVAALLENEEFNISLSLKADDAASRGEVLRLHGSFIVGVEKDGDLLVRLFTEDGSELRVTSRDVNFADGQKHDIDVTLKDGVVGIWVNGTLNASAVMDGTLGSSGSHDLIFGNQFSSYNFDGVLSDLEISVNASDFEPTGTTTEPTGTTTEPTGTTTEPTAVTTEPAFTTTEPADNTAATPEVTNTVATPTPVAVGPTEQSQTPAAPIAPSSITTPPSVIDGSDRDRFEDLRDAVISLTQTQSELAASTVAPVYENARINLTGDAVSARAARDEVDHILGEDAFSISFSLSSAAQDSYGEVMRLHQSFVVTVTEDGELNLRVFDESGSRIRLTTEGAELQDMAPHDIMLAREDGIISIWVDGAQLASKPMPLPLADVGRHDLTFGNIWTDVNFEGSVSNLEVTAEAPAHNSLLVEEDFLSVDPDQLAVSSVISEVVARDGMPTMDGIMARMMQLNEVPAADILSAEPSSDDGMVYGSASIDRLEFGADFNTDNDI